MQLSRAMIDALLPPGVLWQPQEGEGFDNMLTGIGDCMDAVLSDLKQLARVRSPLYTSLLDDLEREYGVIPRSSDESTRRARLLAVKAGMTGDGSLTFLQNVLNAAGFDVQVHANNPPVDPGFFIYYSPSAICGNEAAVCGDSSAGALRGELLVNGAVYDDQSRIVYDIPVDPGYWGLFFFIGGAATRNGDGELTDIEDADVPVSRRGELLNLILKCKPMHSWAGLRIQYV